MKMESRGIEPLALKLLAGMILLAVGLGAGITLYRRAGASVESALKFELSLDQTSWSLPKPENENRLTVSVSIDPLLQDYRGAVSLSAEGIPAGVQVFFSPSSGTCPFSSSMTVVVSAQAPLGTHTITVKATGNGSVKSKPFTLTIQ